MSEGGSANSTPRICHARSAFLVGQLLLRAAHARPGPSHSYGTPKIFLARCARWLPVPSLFLLARFLLTRGPPCCRGRQKSCRAQRTQPWASFFGGQARAESALRKRPLMSVLVWLEGAWYFFRVPGTQPSLVALGGGGSERSLSHTVHAEAHRAGAISPVRLFSLRVGGACSDLLLARRRWGSMACARWC
ncbi:unnamed protein product [Amoebophrya sp. A120]|nr:unnamed protein product [Amoebophrya sp. A120]|eukprot:GSA120T00003226001.1